MTQMPSRQAAAPELPRKRKGLPTKGTLGMALLAVMLLTLSACGGGKPEEVQASPPRQALSATSVGSETGAAVISLNKVGETRISRTVYDYTFRITVQNGSVPQRAVVALLKSAGQGSIIIDGTVEAGDLAAGATATPLDTVTLRHDRSIAFNVSALVWAVGGEPLNETINGIVVPPEPNPGANASSLAGIDVNTNGVRDDIDRSIATRFGNNSTEYGLALIHARSLQKALTEPTEPNAQEHIGSILCKPLAFVKRLGETTSLTLNTSSRRQAYATAFAGSVLTNEGCAK